mgnify:CR=1 FL=1
MDKTEATLANISRQLKIKKIIKSTCYIAIFIAIASYASFGLQKSQAIKLVNDYKKNKKNFVTEKTMINPSIKIKYNDNEIYNIKAKKAFHQDDSEAILENVEAQGNIGKITAGRLKISQEGDRLIFSENPILILNKK